MGTLTPAQWDALNLSQSAFSIEFDDYSADGLQDFKLTNGNEEVIIVQTDDGGFDIGQRKTIISVNTELLGLPNSNGADQ